MAIHRIVKEKFGSVIAFVLLVLLVMTFVIFAIATMSTRNMNNVVGEYWEDRARFGAMSGVQRVLTEVAANPAYNTDLVDVALEGDPDVTWSVDVENNVASNVGKYAPDNRTWIPGGAIYVHAEGKMRTLASSGISTVAAVVSPQRPVFNDALFGTESVTLDNSQTVSWYPGSNSEKLGSIGTNAITDSVVRVINGSFVDGDAFAGVNPAESGLPVLVDGSSSLTGQKKWAQEAKIATAFRSPLGLGPLTPEQTGVPVGAAPPLGELTPGLYGPLRLDNAQITLNGGGSYFFRFLDLRNNARLNVVGATRENPARVYFETSAVFYNGSSVNWNHGTNEPGEPRLLQIYAAESGVRNMYIHGVNQVSFVAAGQELDVDLDNAVMHGAVIARTINAVSSVLRYDTRLKGVPLDGTGGFEILSMVAEPAGLPPAAVPPPPPILNSAEPPPPAPGAPPPPAPPAYAIPPAPPAAVLY